MLGLQVIAEELKTGVRAALHASEPQSSGTGADIDPATERRATRHQGSEIKRSGAVVGDGSTENEERGSIKRNINQLKHIHFSPAQ